MLNRSRLRASLTQAVTAVFAVFMLVLILLCLAAAAGSSRTDAAAWIQAAGSISAICGAIWISNSESRRAQRQRRHDGEVLAQGVKFAIKLTHNEACTIAAELSGPVATHDPECGRYWRTRCRNAIQLLRYCSNQPGHLHPAFVQAGNNAIVLAEEMSEDVDAARGFLLDGRILPLPLAQRLASYQDQFSALALQVDERMGVIGEALDRGNDRLPL
jgi:hypothetical protein